MCRDLIGTIDYIWVVLIILTSIYLFKLTKVRLPVFKIIPEAKNSILKGNIAEIFVIIFWFNLIGIASIIFSFTTNFTLVLRLGITLFLTPFMLNRIKNINPNNYWPYYPSHFNSVLSSLVPRGSPFVLRPFLVLIETIRIFIRPFTLRLRLVANIAAGHIILRLFAEAFCESWGGFIFFIYYLFEFFVAVIQTYIFTLLILIYETT